MLPADSPKRGRNRWRDGQDTYVYFIQATTLGLIKIGWTWDPLERLTRLQIGSPDDLKLLGVIRDASAERLESRLHMQFAHARRHGEWFRPEPDLLAFIALKARDFGEMLMDENAARMNAVLSRNV